MFTSNSITNYKQMVNKLLIKISQIVSLVVDINNTVCDK